ncbi:hypothetical protein SPRG_05819 [Saprolegnia parasitica CBS 223.65]|uniref:Uncharacterized protein n=1 Tax=Saprolegnia parasitica (strain CBS 223.65) TaxID=695850 RepID=A0A067CR55_SAPPC|nr:hypothetical protein SPRG_05819 [Saprolegnia parasitica CBS 223.65]KDO29282.1 hypothetical protein SPRG_05819 [Saprolegnia parasitica CBS 223.65]|eukprot:XP_012199790.1 hypothetical protein SPRG_05819 [Saprolegnia parasitica CBS 223.65]
MAIRASWSPHATSAWISCARSLQLKKPTSTLPTRYSSTPTDTTSGRCVQAGDTALTIACERANYAITELLVAHPTLDVNHRRKDHRPAYRVARKKGARSIMLLLTTHPAFKMPLDADEDEIGGHNWTVRGCLQDIGACFLIMGEILNPFAWCCLAYALSD